MPEIIQQALEALKLQNYYAAVALLLTLAVQVLRKAPVLSDRIWSRIPDGLRWAVPIGAGAVIGFTDAFAKGLGLGDALMAALGGAVAIGFGSMGFAATLRESPIPWDGASGGRPKPQGDDDRTPPTGTKPVGLVTLAVAALCLALAPACGLFGGPDSPADATCAAEGATAKVRCDAYALERCGAYEDNPDACPHAADVDAQCEKFVDEEIARCR